MEFRPVIECLSLSRATRRPLFGIFSSSVVLQPAPRSTLPPLPFPSLNVLPPYALRPLTSDTPAEGDSPRGASHTDPSTAAASVLVVDDDPTILDAVSQTLELVGYQVATAPNGADALTVLETF